MRVVFLFGVNSTVENRVELIVGKGGSNNEQQIITSI